MQIHNFLVLSYILKLVVPTIQLYGYDCGDQVSNLTTISLLRVDDCDIAPKKVETTKIFGQLLQLNDFGEVKIYKCGIKITRIVTHCGMHSHSSRVFGGEVSYYKEISHEECLRVHMTGSIVVGHTQITGLIGNSTTQKSVIFAGNSDHQGQCKGETYMDPYGNFKDVYVAGWVELTLHDMFRTINIEADKIILASGIVCKFSGTTCIDEDASQVFWNVIPEETCGANKYAVIHEGNMDKIIEMEENKIMYSLESEDITFALWKKGQRRICGFELQVTEHPRLFVIEDAKENKFISKNPISAANLDIFTYVNSKFLYVEKHIRKQINQMYNDVLLHKCKLERKILSGALALAAISPEEVAYRIMGEPGYLAVTAGEVIHLVKCLKVGVTPRNTENCYDQLPVTRDKEEYFLSPRTHILIRAGTQIPCDRTLPAMYKIKGNWFKVLPELVEVKSPETLKPQVKPTWKYVSPESLAISGVYNQKDVNRLRDMILFPVEKPSVLNKLALGASGRDINTEGITMNKLFDKEAMAALAESTWTKMWSKFLSFGTASAGIIGIFMLGRLIKLLADTVIHGYAIYSLYGFSIHILGAIWNSVTQLLLHLGQRKETDERNNETENANTENNKNDENKNNAEKIYEDLKVNKLYPNV